MIISSLISGTLVLCTECVLYTLLVITLGCLGAFLICFTLQILGIIFSTISLFAISMPVLLPLFGICVCVLVGVFGWIMIPAGGLLGWTLVGAVVGGPACIVCGGGPFALLALLSQSGISRDRVSWEDRNPAPAFAFYQYHYPNPILRESEIERVRVEEPSVAPDFRSYKEIERAIVKKMNFDPMTGSFYPIY